MNTTTLPIDPNDVRQLVEEAAVIVRRHFGEAGQAGAKVDGSPVTAADVEVDAFLRLNLLKLLPSARWLSEESEPSASSTSEWVWIVDPLDGTKEFVQRIPEIAISVGLVHNSTCVFGTVVNPITGEGGMGWIGSPPVFWGMRAVSGPAPSLAHASVCVSRTEARDGVVLPYLNRVGEWRPVGSVAYKLLRVAAGIEDLTFSVQPKSEWDICGGVALIESSGHVYRRFDREACRFNQPSPKIAAGTVAGPTHLVDEFLSMLQSAALQS